MILDLRDGDIRAAVQATWHLGQSERARGPFCFLVVVENGEIGRA